jgi:hypothetical protein
VDEAMERESFIIFPQESRDGYLVGLALAEAVHEEYLRRDASRRG